ncbi:MAG: FAD-dependent oxidoreductase, partial [Deltaproteobacteria bacterium]|nr:FAD-dependent oxidoreductase [Deltaproteobacteria bacterium]
MITFKLNGKEVQGEEGQYILQVAEKHGVEIPTLCYHKALEPAGMCRLCTVELFDGRRTRFVTACNYPIWEGMEVNTDTEAIREGRKLIVELLLARCPDVPLLKELATKYDIKEPRFKEEGDDCILCGLCVRICEKMGNSALSLTGRGVDIKVDTPFHVQTDVCMACGACAFVCPTGHIKLEDITRHAVKPIPSEYDMGLKGRKPIYVPYAQAVPNTPAIDRSKCMHFKTGGCQICAEFCGVNAIDYSQVDETIELNVGSIILAPGFQPFDPSKFETYSYTKSPNIITSMEFERILSATGPYQGHLVRPSDQKEPKKIAWLQCVGSRDVHKCDHGYCSSVCCMYAIKEAVVSKEHAGSDLDCAIFFMDMRTHGKDFERFYNDAKEKHGVRFICSRVPTIESVEGSDDLLIPYVNEDGDIIEESFDMIVLSVGLETPPEVIELGRNLGIDLTEGGFCKTESFHPVTTSREGIYVCGAFQGPKDIPQSVIESSSAAAEAGALLSESRNTLIREKKIPEEREIQGERPRIGVFVCHCGINIGGVVDVPGVRDYAASLPYVEYVTDNLFTCSTDTQDTITQVIREENLNRIVVAACTPRTHEPLFQETIAAAGLNKYLFEMTNIRNQDSWVHKDDPEMATEKAKDLVRMAVAKVALMEPLRETELNVNQNALVIGGG